VKDRGQVISISGAVGSGKSSLLRWAAEEIQKSGGHENLAITKEFYETPGMAFKIYRDLLKDLQSHTKGGRFRAIIGNDEVMESLNAALTLLEAFTSVTEPVGAFTRLAKVITGAVTPPQKVEYEHILSSILTVFQKISVELKKNDRFITILLDDVQWSSEPDLRLLKDLIRNIPQNIAFLLAYRREDKTNQMYEELMGELNRWDQTEIPLYRLDSAGIKDFAARRYSLALDDSSARYLERKVGDPFSLVTCFNLLQKNGLSPNINNLDTILPEALEKPARSFLSGLDQPSRDRVNLLCILEPPTPFSVIACITGTKPQEAARLQSDLDNSIVFRRIEHGLYDFGHSSLREYCRRELPEIQELELHKQAMKCFENLLDKLPDKQYAFLSLAEHAFYGEDYQTAFDLNFALEEGAYEHYDYSTALELMKRAKLSAERLHDRDKLAATYHHLGMVFQALYKHSEALDNYTQSLKIKRELGNRDGEAGTLHQIGRVYQVTHRYDKALDYHTQSLTIKRELGNRGDETRILHQIGMVHEETYRYDEALDCYTQSLAIEREIGDRDTEAGTLHQIGTVYQAMHRYDEALDWYNQSLAIRRKLGDQEGEANTLHQIGMVHEETYRYDEALDCYNLSLTIEREIGNRGDEAGTLHQIGMVYQAMRRYDEALDCYTQSLTIERELGNRGGEASTLHQIGMVYQATHWYDEALDYYTQSLAIKRELGNRDGEAGTLHQIGTVYEETGRYDEALDCYNQSLAIERELGNRDGEALTLAQTAILLGTRSDFDESTRCFGIALFIAIEHQMPITTQILLNLATNLDYMGDEQFTAAWRKAFDGADPPLDLIREAKRLFEAADAD
jgi:tetratricopeptide (TPR) repeat protein